MLRPREAVQEIVQLHRTKRDTPRPELLEQGIECYEDPAPDWLVRMLRLVARHTGGELCGGYSVMRPLVEWCKQGDEEARSAQVCALTEHWIGPRVPMLRSFLANVRITGGGRLSKCPFCKARIWRRGERSCSSPQCVKKAEEASDVVRREGDGDA